MSNPIRPSAILLAAAAALLGSGAPAAPREYPVFHTDRPPAIDGDVRDDIWRAVPWSGDFTGLQGAKADVQTQFAMAWDEKFLYVAVRCREPKPETIHADIAGRDPRIVNDDHIEILLAQSDKPTAFFQIILNAGRGRVEQFAEGGAKATGPEPERRGFRLDDSGLESATRVRAGEWVVEAAIPLPKVAWPLKKGATYLGNICRVRPGGAVKEMAWNPVHRDLHKSADFGAFKLCGPAPKPAPIHGGDSASLRNGDAIVGDLLRLADGKIEFSSPALAEPVSFSAAELLRLDLAWTPADAAPARFLLNDGAEISGRIVSMSADAVGIESPALGRISVPRGRLSHISFSGFSVESHFESGILKPWEAVSGSCNFAGGILQLFGETRGGQYQAVLSLPLHQAGTVTLIADYDPTPSFTPVRVQLFADRAHPQMQIQNGLMFNLLPSAVFTLYKDGQPALQSLPGPRLALDAKRARLKVAYNPADGFAKAWYNGKPVAEMAVPDGPAEGEYVVFGATRPVTLRRLAVYCGRPAPDEPVAGPKSGEILAWLLNGDMVRASQAEFADGQFVLATEFGPMKLSPDRVMSIAFPAQAGNPPADMAAAWIEASGNRFELQVQAITGDSVIGTSAEIGDVRIPRHIVKSIVFPEP